MLSKVKRGDPLKIAASTFNAFIDAARDFRERQQRASREVLREYRQTGIVLVRNESGAARQRFDVLAIASPIITPNVNADAFKERVALRGVLPEARHKGRFAVLLEPAAVGALARAVVGGVCSVRVQMANENDCYAEVQPGATAQLVSGSSGAAYLLWVQPAAEREVPDVAWTIARLGVPAGYTDCQFE